MSGQPTVEDECLNAFQKEFDYLCRTLRRLGVPPSEIEDLAQEVFLVLHRAWGELDRTRPLRPYLFGIAFRIASANGRRRRREWRLIAPELEDRGPWPDQELQTKQDRAIIISALDRIPLPRRAVLVMHDIDDVPMQTVASVLAIPLFTTYSRLRKARRELEIAVRHLMKEKNP